MKKLILLSLVLLSSTLHALAGDDSTRLQHVPYVYVGTNYVPHALLSYSAEIGYWGTTANTTYGMTFDMVPNRNATTDLWLGIKAYYTTHNENKLCYMVYIAPKYKITGVEDELIEFGFNPYYTLNKNLLLGVTIGNQAYATSQWNLFTSIGIVYLFNKKN